MASGDRKRQKFVYKVTHLSTGKWYIGSHHGYVDDAYLGSGSKISALVRDEGVQNFIREVLHVGDDFREVEEKLLHELDAANDPMSYNLTNEAFGYGNGMLGRKHTPETIAKMRLSHTGHKHTEATKAKMRQRRVPVETRTKIRAKLVGRYTGENSPSFGVKRSQETLRKLSAARHKDPERQRAIAKIAGKASAEKTRTRVTPEIAAQIIELGKTHSIRAISRKLGIKNRHFISALLKSRK